MGNSFHLAADFLGALFPECCPVCRVGLPFPGPCAKHAMQLDPGASRCSRCARRSVPGLPAGFRCGQCARRSLGLTRVLTLGDYHETAPLRDWLLSLKHGGCRTLAWPLGLELGGVWRREHPQEPGPVLVPVPLHGIRRLERGYDQALLLAQAIAQTSGGQVVRALRRRRWTAPQGAGELSRKANVHGAFRVRRWPNVLRGQAPIANREIWLVDDVLTSGATLQACAQALRVGGARRVGALVVARAGRPEDALE